MRILLSIVVLLASCVSANASSIVLVSQSGGTFDYGLSVEPNETVEFGLGLGLLFDLSGVSGVTAAAIDDTFFVLDALAGFNNTQVTVLSTMPFAFTNGNNVPQVIGTLHVTSNATAIGHVNYAIGGLYPASGTVLGPVAAPNAVPVPEPSTLMMLGSAVTAMFYGRRRRRSLKD